MPINFDKKKKLSCSTSIREKVDNIKTRNISEEKKEERDI